MELVPNSIPIGGNIFTEVIFFWIEFCYPLHKSLMPTLPTLCISRDACSPLGPIFFTFSCNFRKKTGSLYLGSPGSKNLRYRLELHDYTWDTHHLIAIFCSGTHTYASISSQFVYQKVLKSVFDTKWTFYFFPVCLHVFFNKQMLFSRNQVDCHTFKNIYLDYPIPAQIP